MASFSMDSDQHVLRQISDDHPYQVGVGWLERCLERSRSLAHRTIKPIYRGLIAGFGEGRTRDDLINREQRIVRDAAKFVRPSSETATS